MQSRATSRTSDWGICPRLGSMNRLCLAAGPGHGRAGPARPRPPSASRLRFAAWLGLGRALARQCRNSPPLGSRRSRPAAIRPAQLAPRRGSGNRSCRAAWPYSAALRASWRDTRPNAGPARGRARRAAWASPLGPTPARADPLDSRLGGDSSAELVPRGSAGGGEFMASASIAAVDRRIEGLNEGHQKSGRFSLHSTTRSGLRVARSKGRRPVTIS